MTFIRTTATMVEKMRAESKAKARSTGASLQTCQDQVARSHGYEHWKHVTMSLSSTQADAAMQGGGRSTQSALLDTDQRLVEELDYYFERLSRSRPAEFTIQLNRGSAFHKVTIEGVHFAAYVEDEPYLSGEDGDAPLGVCVLEKVSHRESNLVPHRQVGLYVCKYDAGQPRISLAGLSERGVTTLAQHFGLLNLAGNRLVKGDSILRYHPYAPAYAFFRSPAALSLQKWCKAHPKLSANIKSETDYLLYWDRFIGKSWPSPRRE